MSRDTERDLSALLRDLETTLADLQEVVESERGRDRPAPPQPTEVLRFTEEYTIPTMISVLETTIKSLELLQGVLRLAGPGRSLDGRDRERSPERRLLEERLDDLRRVLTATEEPSDPTARDVLGEARSLTAEIESRLEEARSDRTRGWDDRRGGSGRRRSRADERDGGGAVRIPVDDGDGGGVDPEDGEDGVDDEEESTVDVDVEAELQSIKDEVHGTENESQSGDERKGSEDGGDAGETADGGDDSEGGAPQDGR